MNEYVLVEFVVETTEDHVLLWKKLKELGDDFQYVVTSDEQDEDGRDAVIVNGRMESKIASLIKLQDAFLSERMRISYIPDELKNKYRK